MNEEEFINLAKEKFGDKIIVSHLRVSDSDLNKLNKIYENHVTHEDLINYGTHVWLAKEKCPNCNSDLTGILGTFKWGIVHGQGFCSHCNSIEFRFYHYIGDPKLLVQLFSVIGFDKNNNE